MFIIAIYQVVSRVGPCFGHLGTSIPGVSMVRAPGVIWNSMIAVTAFLRTVFRIIS